MVYKVHAELRFALSTVRSTALVAIGSEGAVSVQLRGLPGLVVDRQRATQTEAQAEYAKVTALTTVSSGSVVRWHACAHDEAAGYCGTVTQKVW